MIQHDSTPNSFACPILTHLLSQEQLCEQVTNLKKQVLNLEQQLALVKRKESSISQQVNDSKDRIDSLSEDVMNHKFLIKEHQRRWDEWDWSPNPYSNDGDANCNS